MSLAGRITVKCVYVASCHIRLGPRPEVIFEILPVIAALKISSKRATGIITAMYHAVFASRISRDTVHHAIFAPIHLSQHLVVTRVMAVSHQVAGSFPAFDVTGWYGPGSTGQFAFTGEKFLVHRRAKNRESFTPFLNFRKFLTRHR